VSTKNLSRTIIEGGRAARNQYDRKKSSQKLRAAHRRLGTEAKSLIDTDELGVNPKRCKVYKNFDDKLGAVHRWVKKQVGKKWDDVYSELSKRFDRRTVAGNHVIEDHILNSITVSIFHKDHNYKYPQKDHIYVDEDGILRNKGTGKRRNNPDYVSERELVKWKGDNRIHRTGDQFFWMVPVNTPLSQCTSYSCLRPHQMGEVLVSVPACAVLAIDKPSYLTEVVDGVVKYYKLKKAKFCKKNPRGYKQGPKLTNDDLLMWNRLSIPQRLFCLLRLTKKERQMLYSTHYMYERF